MRTLQVILDLCQHKKDWRNPNEVMADLDTIIFTATVTVGVDLTIPWKSVFVHAASPGAPPPREVFQMVGRFRFLDDPCIKLLVSSWDFERDLVVDHLEQAEVNLRNRKDAMIRGVSFSQHMVGLDITFTPNTMTKITAFNQVEQMSFCGAFRHMARMKGFRLFVRDVDNKLADAKFTQDLSADEAKAGNVLKSIEHEALQQLYADGFDQTDADEIDVRIKQREATAEEKLMLKLWRVTKNYDGQLTPQQYDVASERKTKSAITSQACLRRVSVRDMLNKDETNRRFEVWAGMTHTAHHEVYKLLNGMMEKLCDGGGVSESKEGDEDFSRLTRTMEWGGKVMEDNLAFILDTCTQVSRLKKVNSDCTNKDMKEASIKLNAVLSAIGFKVSNQRKRIGGVRQRVYVAEIQGDVEELLKINNQFKPK